MGSERRAVKLLIFDPDDRLLLLRAADPASERWGWYPVGGGIEPGEGVQQAARREAAEETGLDITEFGPEVWRRRHVYHWLGTSRQVYERWFVVWAPHFTPDFGGLSPTERRSVTGSRWWTAAELWQSEEPFAPPDLPGRIRDLLTHGPPATPIELGPVPGNDAS